MSDAVMPQAAAAVADRIVEAAAAPTFPDLAWAHYDWDAKRRAGTVDREAEAHYRRTLAAFEREHGELTSAYWVGSDASGVGVTVRRRGLLSFGDCEVRFHRATDWGTRSTPEIPEALDRCETLAMKSREVLRSTSERIAIQWIFTIASHLLGAVERAGGQPTEHDAQRASREAQQELHRVERYYDRAGTKAGRIVYAQGMILGALALLAVAALTGALLWLFGASDAHATDVRRFFACFTAGALGAIVSVMTRMASERNRLVVDYEVGRTNLMLLGAFRPAVGSIFGVVLYFAIKGDLLLPQIKPLRAETAFYYYTVLAFFAGFSERFTKVLIDSAEKVVPAPATAHPPAPPTEAGPHRA